MKRARLRAIAPRAFVAIAHIGATPVTGRAARPIIDSMAAVDSLADVNALIETPCDRCDPLHAIVPDAFVATAHIGGTPASRLAAKPIIDIMEVVDSLAGRHALIKQLCDNGCTTSTAFNVSLIDCKWSMRCETGIGQSRAHRHRERCTVDDHALSRRLAQRPRTGPTKARLKAARAATRPVDREVCTTA